MADWLDKLREAGAVEAESDFVDAVAPVWAEAVAVIEAADDLIRQEAEGLEDIFEANKETLDKALAALREKVEAQ